MKDLGELRTILGLEVERDETGIYVGQQIYIEKILYTFGHQHCRPAKTPAMPPKTPDTSPKLERNTEYLQAVGSLNYLATCTRPDIAYAVSQVARKMHAPTTEDWNAVKQIFRYCHYEG